MVRSFETNDVGYICRDCRSIWLKIAIQKIKERVTSNVVVSFRYLGNFENMHANMNNGIVSRVKNMGVAHRILAVSLI